MWKQIEKTLKITEITPYAKNIKKHSDEQIEQIAWSIEQFWYIQPICVDSDNTIVIGHWRFEAVKYLWWKEVKVIELSWFKEEDIRALRIADNKMNESPYDFSNLSSELKELSALFDVKTLWFTDMELANLWILMETKKTAQEAEDSLDSFSLDLDDIGEAMERQSVPSEIMGSQNQKKPITFFCDNEEYEILYPIFATTKKWEANTQLLIEMVKKI